MSNKMIHCQACGEEIAANVKSCPKCGAHNKKPIYKKWWFWVIIVLLLAGGGVSSSSGSSTTPAEPAPQKEVVSAAPEEKVEPIQIEYTSLKATELFDALKENALKAEKTYQDLYVEISGYLAVIDSDGKYISIGADPHDYTYFLQGVQCYIKSDTQRDQILEMSIGDPVVVRGKITSIGEVIGYSLNIDSIN